MRTALIIFACLEVACLIGLPLCIWWEGREHPICGHCGDSGRTKRLKTGAVWCRVHGFDLERAADSS